MRRLFAKLAYLILICAGFSFGPIFLVVGKTYYAQIYVDRLPTGQLIHNVQGNPLLPVNSDAKITLQFSGTRYQTITISPPDNWTQINSESLKLFVLSQSGEVENWQQLELIESDFKEGNLNLRRYRGQVSIERLVYADTDVLFPDITADDELQTVSIAFVSKSTDLDQISTQIDQDEIYYYHRQLQDGVTTNLVRVSIAEDGNMANSASVQPRISADGNYVVFVSKATDIRPAINDLEPANNVQQIYLWRNDGTTRRISQGPNQNYGDADSQLPVVNSDGKLVAFQSQADNLVYLPSPLNPDDPSTIPDQGTDFQQIYQWREGAGLIRISQNSSQTAGNSDSQTPDISGSGTSIVFVSTATNLIDGRSLTTSVQHIYLWREIGGIICISQQSDQTLANADSESPAISADGNYIVFVSSATNLVPNDTNGCKDIFCYQISTGRIDRVSISTDRAEANQNCLNPSISSDGRFVVFQSKENNLAPSAKQELLNVFVHDRQTGITQLVSQSQSGENGEAVAGEGRISPDGKKVIFVSASTDLAPLSSNEDISISGKKDIFLVTNPPRSNSDNVLKVVYTAITDDKPTQSNFVVSIASEQVEVPFQLVLDGSGYIAADKPSLPAGGRNQSLKFTYTNQAGEDLKNAKLYLQIPVDWPSPNLEASAELTTNFSISPAKDVIAEVVPLASHPTETSLLTQTVELTIKKLRQNKSLTIDYDNLVIPNYLGIHDFVFSLASENKPFGHSVEVGTIKIATTKANLGSGLLSAEAFGMNGNSLGQILSANTTINKVVFTFTAEGIMDGGQIRLQLPVGWTAPQSYDANSAGFVMSEPAQVVESVSTNGQQINLQLRWLPAGQNLYLTYANNTNYDSPTPRKDIPTSDPKKIRLGSDFRLWTTSYELTNELADSAESLQNNDLLTIQAEDGSGILTSSARGATADTTTLKAGEGGSLELTYTAVDQMDGGQIRLEQPENWITPTTDKFQVISEGLVGQWIFETENGEGGRITIPIQQLAKNQTIKLVFDSILVVPPVRPLAFKLSTQGSPSGQLISKPSDLSLDVAIDFNSLDIKIPAGISLLHLPLQPRFIDGIHQPLTKISELYDALEAILPDKEDIRFIITQDFTSQNWKSYPQEVNSNLDFTFHMGLIVVRPNTVEPISLKLEGSVWPDNSGGNDHIVPLTKGWNLIGLPIKPHNVDNTNLLDLLSLASAPNNLMNVMVAGEPWTNPDLNAVPIQGGAAFFVENSGVNQLTIRGDNWNATESLELAPYSIPQATPVLQIYGRLRDKSGRVLTQMETNSLSCRLINPSQNPTPTVEKDLQVDQAGQFRLTWVNPPILARLDDQIQRFLIQSSANGSRVLANDQLTITEDHLLSLTANWDIYLDFDAPNQPQIESVNLGGQQALLTLPPMQTVMHFKTAKRTKISNIPQAELRANLEQRPDIEHILEIEIADSNGKLISHLNEQPLTVQIPSKQADTIVLVPSNGDGLEFLPTNIVGIDSGGIMLVAQANHLSYILTLKNHQPTVSSTIDNLVGSPLDQDKIIDLNQYFTDQDLSFGDQLTFVIETAESINYMYDGTALEYIDAATINYQNHTDHFDDLLMTNIFTFVDSGLTVKVSDQRGRISATISPQAINQTVVFDFGDGSTLTFTLANQYQVGNLNGTLILSRGGLFENSVVDPHTGKAKVEVPPSGLLRLDFNELIEGSTQLIAKAKDIQGEETAEINFEIELTFDRTLDWTPANVNFGIITDEHTNLSSMVKTVTLQNTGQTVLKIKDIYANWSGISSVELSKYKQQLFSQSVNYQLAVNQSLEIPISLVPHLDLFVSSLPVTGIKLIVEIDKLVPTAIPIMVEFSQLPADAIQTEMVWPSDGARMVKIPAGGFEMGDHFSNSINQSVHSVEISSFYIDKYEVTNLQYQSFTQATGYPEPSLWATANYVNFAQDDQPVVGVSWQDAMAYAEWTGKRLPTEAEWEYAARGGLIGLKYLNSDILSRDEANYQNSEGKDIWIETATIGQLAINGYGLHDMLGNVAEWCLDLYQDDFYVLSPLRNPVAGYYDISSAINSYRQVNINHAVVVRGGSWNSTEADLLVSDRRSVPASTRSTEYGFRCVVRPTVSYISNQKIRISTENPETSETTITTLSASRLEIKHDWSAVSDNNQSYHQVGDWIPLVISLLDTNENVYQTVSSVTVQLAVDNLVLGQPIDGKFIDGNGWEITTIDIPALKDSVQVFYQQTRAGTARLTVNAVNWQPGSMNLSVVSNIAEVILQPKHGWVRANTPITVTVITDDGRSDLIGHMKIAGYQIPLTAVHRGNYNCQFKVIESNSESNLNQKELALNDGQYPITFKFNHLTGSLSHRISDPIVIEVDNQPPQILQANLSGNRQQLNNGETSTVMVLAESGLSVKANIGRLIEVAEPNTIIQLQAMEQSGTYVGQFSIPLQMETVSGQYPIEIWATDLAGNSSAITELLVDLQVNSYYEYDLVIPPGISLVQLPQKIYSVNNSPVSLNSLADLYHLLNVNQQLLALIHPETVTNRWYLYQSLSDRNKPIDPRKGFLIVMSPSAQPISLALKAVQPNVFPVPITLSAGYNLTGQLSVDSMMIDHDASIQISRIESGQWNEVSIDFFGEISSQPTSQAYIIKAEYSVPGQPIIQLPIADVGFNSPQTTNLITPINVPPISGYSSSIETPLLVVSGRLALVNLAQMEDAPKLTDHNFEMISQITSTDGKTVGSPPIVNILDLVIQEATPVEKSDFRFILFNLPVLAKVGDMLNSRLILDNRRIIHQQQIKVTEEHLNNFGLNIPEIQLSADLLVEDSPANTIGLAITVGEANNQALPIYTIQMEEDEDKIVPLNQIFDDVENFDDLTFQVEPTSLAEIMATIQPATINQTANLVLKTVEANWHGNAKITLMATDDGKKTVRLIVDVIVKSVNDRPVLEQELPDLILLEDQKQVVSLSNQDEVSPYFSDVDSVWKDKLKFSAKLNSTAEIQTPLLSSKISIIDQGDSGSETVLELIPNQNQHGTAKVTVTATDQAGVSQDQTFNVTVQSVNDAPKMKQAISEIETGWNQPTTVDLNNIFSDPDIETDQDQLTFHVRTENSPVKTELTDSSLLTLTLTNPLTVDNISDQLAELAVVATDSAGLTATHILRLKKFTGNHPPTVISTIENMLILEDEAAITFDLTDVFEDTDIQSESTENDYSDKLRFQARETNNLLVLTIIDGELKLTPRADQNGVTELTIMALDMLNAKAELTFEVQITPVNDPPILVKQPQLIEMEEDSSGHQLSMVDIFNDPDISTNGDRLHYEVSDDQLLHTILEGEQLTLIPKKDQYGTTQLFLTAIDQQDSQRRVPMQIKVNPVNDPPRVQPKIDLDRVPRKYVGEKIPLNIGLQDLLGKTYQPADQLMILFESDQPSGQFFDTNHKPITAQQIDQPSINVTYTDREPGLSLITVRVRALNSTKDVFPASVLPVFFESTIIEVQIGNRRLFSKSVPIPLRLNQEMEVIVIGVPHLSGNISLRSIENKVIVTEPLSESSQNAGIYNGKLFLDQSADQTLDGIHNLIVKLGQSQAVIDSAFNLDSQPPTISPSSVFLNNIQQPIEPLFIVKNNQDQPFVIDVKTESTAEVWVDISALDSKQLQLQKLALTDQIFSTQLTVDANTDIASGPKPIRVVVQDLAGNRSEVKIMVDFSAYRTLEMTIPKGLSFIHLPLEITKINDKATTIQTVGDLFSMIGSDKISHLITYHDQQKVWQSYLGPESRGRLADQPLNTKVGMLALLKPNIDSIKLKLTGKQPPVEPVNLKAGVNLIGTPYNSQFKSLDDLFQLDGLKGQPISVVVRDRGRFRTISAADVQTVEERTVQVGQAFLILAPLSVVIDSP